MWNRVLVLYYLRLHPWVAGFGMGLKFDVRCTEFYISMLNMYTTSDKLLNWNQFGLFGWNSRSSTLREVFDENFDFRLQ